MSDDIDVSNKLPIAEQLGRSANICRPTVILFLGVCIE
jgi:hypothetical protein